jgi:hypothetical protein
MPAVIHKYSMFKEIALANDTMALIVAKAHAEVLHQEQPTLGQLWKVVPPSSALVLVAAGIQW